MPHAIVGVVILDLSTNYDRVLPVYRHPDPAERQPRSRLRPFRRQELVSQPVAPRQNLFGLLCQPADQHLDSLPYSPHLALPWWDI